MTHHHHPPGSADGETSAILNRREFLNRTTAAGVVAGGLAMVAGFGRSEASAAQQPASTGHAQSHPDHVQPQGSNNLYAHPLGLVRPVDCPASWSAMQNAF